MMNLGGKFAQHIDRGEFDEAGEMISDDCIYRAGDTTHRGRKGIVAMYRELQSGMKPPFDEVTYDSVVDVIDGETCSVHYFDEYRKGNRIHRMRTEEILSFKDGMIVNIEQLSNRGEVEAFRKFWKETRS
jgi:hypothetical protein